MARRRGGSRASWTTPTASSSTRSSTTTTTSSATGTARSSQTGGRRTRATTRCRWSTPRCGSWPRARWAARPTATAARSALLERSHSQSRVVELLPVELGGLLEPAPDHGLARGVDRVGVGVALLHADAGDRPGQRERDVVERVVVVVADDHAPVAAEPGARPAGARKLDRLGHRVFRLPAPTS